MLRNRPVLRCPRSVRSCPTCGLLSVVYLLLIVVLGTAVRWKVIKLLGLWACSFWVLSRSCSVGSAHRRSPTRRALTGPFCQDWTLWPC